MKSRQFHLNRAKMIDFLNELEANAGIARSLYVPPGLALPEIEKRLKVFDPATILVELPGLILSSKTGAAFFWGLSGMYLVLPPFPVTGEYSAQGYAVEPLRSQLEHDHVIALVLVRLGSYAVGVCQGENLINSKVGTGLVHGRHRQGGSSAQRFQLHREKQIESFLSRVCGHVREQLEPQKVDYLVYGGARTTILLLQKQCPFLRQFDNRTLPPLLDIPEPRQKVLETVVGRVWSSQIIEWHENYEVA